VAAAPADDSKLLRQLLAGVAAAQGRAERPSLLISHTVRPFSELSEEILDTTGCNYLPCGVEHGIRAVARAIEWSKLAREVRTSASVPSAVGARPTSERQVLEYLRDRDVPVVPAKVVNNANEAVSHARVLGSAVALKIVSPDIPHKTEVGGVMLDVAGDDNVAAAYEKILASARKALPQARIEGISVGPMRDAGVELFVGTMRDPQWGPVITVGLGGVWVEVLRDTSLRLLPIAEDDVLAMLDELRGKALLNGLRGTPAVDRGAVAKVVVAIGDAALALGPQLLSLEINPLRASGGRVEALDGWAEWSEASG
jgi:acyl-CoA synthetase (NDP forming)